jgi:hypothetical protein
MYKTEEKKKQENAKPSTKYVQNSLTNQHTLTPIRRQNVQAMTGKYHRMKLEQCIPNGSSVTTLKHLF